MAKYQSIALMLSIMVTNIVGQPVRLSADGTTTAYTQFSNAFGGIPYEVPDCVHPEFGDHITQMTDVTLNRPVFVFHLHKTPDDDRCIKFDRQRNEVKTYALSPEYLKGYYGETVTFSWNFKLDANFQASNPFCHIHQIKFVNGDDSMPQITITPSKQDPEDVLQLLHMASDCSGTFCARVLVQEPLSLYKGVWIHVYEKVTYGSNGSYQVHLTHTSDGTQLMSYSSTNIDMWRSETEFGRPKWGLYRSILNIEDLRDEQVLFDSFCLAKGEDECDK